MREIANYINVSRAWDNAKNTSRLDTLEVREQKLIPQQSSATRLEIH